MLDRAWEGGFALTISSQPWRPKLGGALELYALHEESGAVLPAPVDVLPPEFGYGDRGAGAGPAASCCWRIGRYKYAAHARGRLRAGPRAARRGGGESALAFVPSGDASAMRR